MDMEIKDIQIDLKKPESNKYRGQTPSFKLPVLRCFNELSNSLPQFKNEEGKQEIVENLSQKVNAFLEDKVGSLADFEEVIKCLKLVDAIEGLKE